MGRNRVKADPSPATFSKPPQTDADATPEAAMIPAPDLASILEWPVRQLLEQSGVSVDNLIVELRNYAERNPGQAPLAQTVVNFIQAELGPAQIAAAVALLTKGVTQLVFDGKGPVAHSGCELV